MVDGFATLTTSSMPQNVEKSLKMPIQITVVIFGIAMKDIKKIQIRLVA